MTPDLRPYEPCDRDGVLELCAATGFLGADIAPVIPDRISFARIVALPYVLFEPGLATVLESDGIAGYAIGAAAPWFDPLRNLFVAKEFARIGVRLAFDPSYRAANAEGWRNMVTTPFGQVPDHPSGVHAHVHVNLREDVRGLGYGRTLIERFEARITQRGIDTYYGDVFTSQRHPKRAFERIGFEVLDSRVNEAFGSHAEDVELTTIVKRL